MSDCGLSSFLRSDEAKIFVKLAEYAYSPHRNCRGELNKWGSGNLGKIFWKVLKLSLGMGYNMCQCAYLDQLCKNQLIKLDNMLYFFIYLSSKCEF